MRPNPLDQFGDKSEKKPEPKSSAPQPALATSPPSAAAPSKPASSNNPLKSPMSTPLQTAVAYSAPTAAQPNAAPVQGDSQPGFIRSLIETSRRWLRTGWVATGTGITVGLLTSLLLIAGLIDLVIVLWPSFRFVALMVVLIPTSLALGWGVLRPLLRRISNRAVARKIEAQLPGIHNRLVSCVDLEATAQTPAISGSFYRRLLTEAIDRVRDFHPKRLLDREHLKRSAIFAGIGLFSFLVVLQIFSDRLPTALARILSPFADIPPASGVVYKVEPGDQKVLRGDEVTFTVTVEKGTPEELHLELDVTEGDETGKSLRYELVSQSESIWTFRLPGFESSFDYRVRGGGTWSPLYHVKMLDRPRIAGLKTILTYPSYMGAIPPEQGLPDVADVTGPIDSQVEVVVQVEGDPTVGQIELLQPRVKSIPILDRPERIWLEKQLPEGTTAEGTWEWIPEHAGRLAHRHAPAAGLTNHQFLNAPIGFRIKSGEVLFADVYLDGEQPSEAVMLQFHDGQSWEHRAYWGADVITVGQPETVSRFSAGPLPEKGQWVRLEIPASLVDLEGRTLHGISFAQFNGSCWWGKAGTVPPSVKHIDELVVVETIPMQNLGAVESHTESAATSSDTNAPEKATAATASVDATQKPRQLWSGKFPLKQDGFYRVELRNELGNPNSRMKEGKLTAIPDRPPQVIVERPGADLVLSAPQKVPLSISAFDDFGLADLVLAVQIGETGGFRGRPVKHYESLQKADS
ncbi:MAG: hypothetical protein ACKVT0_00105, partial [Planctomycetaceae bacterium]